MRLGGVPAAAADPLAPFVTEDADQARIVLPALVTALLHDEETVALGEP